MTVDQLIEEWNNLTVARKKEAVKNLFDLIVKDFEYHTDLILEMLNWAREAESDDGFGTEGARL